MVILIIILSNKIYKLKTYNKVINYLVYRQYKFIEKKL